MHFSRASLPVMPASLGFLTCAWEQRLEILSKDRKSRGFRDLEESLPLYADTACDTLTPSSLHKGMSEPQWIHFYILGDHSHVLIQRISLIMALICIMAEDKHK